MASRNKSWGPSEIRRTRIAITIPLILLSLFLAIVPVYALTDRTGCPRYPICLMPSNGSGVTLKTKYGQLTPNNNMVFNNINVNANGSIVFEANGFLPVTMDILQFNAESYGNGSFQIRILGGVIASAGFGLDGPAVDLHPFTGEVWLTAPMTTTMLLTISYDVLPGLSVGPNCFIVCISGSQWGGLLILAAAGLLVALLIFSHREKREKTVYEMTVGQ